MDFGLTVLLRMDVVFSFVWLLCVCVWGGGGVSIKKIIYIYNPPFHNLFYKPLSVPRPAGAYEPSNNQRGL